MNDYPKAIIVKVVSNVLFHEPQSRFVPYVPSFAVRPEPHFYRPLAVGPAAHHRVGKVKLASVGAGPEF